MNKITDTALTRGRVKIMAYNAQGELIEFRTGPNLIVNGGRAAVAAALAGQADQEITALGFGEGGAPAQPTDTGLTSPISKPLISVQASANSVEFQAELDTTEGNGTTFREVGLFTQAGDLFARHVIGAFDKTNTVRLLVVWTIYS